MLAQAFPSSLEELVESELLANEDIDEEEEEVEEDEETPTCDIT
jgi:hypothetical protein